MKIETVYIGVIPGKFLPGSVPFRTDVGGSYHNRIEGAEYQCRINGGAKRYFFIEERNFIYFPGTNKKPRIGNIVKIHHYNREHFPAELKYKQQ